MELAVFLLFGLLALTSAIVVVAHPNPVYSVMSLVVTLVCLAVLFVLLGAPFLGALQVLVYTGAILVLFLFVLMLLNVGRETLEPVGRKAQQLIVVTGAAALAALLVYPVWGGPLGRALPQLSAEDVALKPLARALFTTYLLPFEIVGLLLLAAVIAATVLARRPTPRREEGDS